MSAQAGCLLYGSPGRTKGQGRGQDVTEDHGHKPLHCGWARCGCEERLNTVAREAGRDPWKKRGAGAAMILNHK